MERRALGKGISALIPGRESEGKNEVIFVQTGRIKSNHMQPRENFNQEQIEDLAQSIKEKGVIQPLIVRRQGDLFELIAGERRLRAATLIGIAEVPVIVKDVDDQNLLELALIENVQREDLNPIEEARAFHFLIEKYNLTQERISEIIGKSRVSIANTLRLLKLPQEIQEEMRKGRITFAHGRAMLELEDENQQRKMAQEIISKGLSVKELESLIKIHRPRGSKRRIGLGSRDPIVHLMEEELQQILATKVRIVKKKKRGHVTIEFYSHEDLERIVNFFKRS